MNTTVDSNDAVKDGYVGLAVVGVIGVFLFCWFAPSVGVLLGLSILAAMGVSAIVLTLGGLLATVETVFSGARVPANKSNETIRIKRRPVGA